MKQFAEAVEVMDHHNNGYANTGRDWQSDTVVPFSDRPEDRGLYIVTTLDKFFQLDLEQSKNGNGNGTPAKV